MCLALLGLAALPATASAACAARPATEWGDSVPLVFVGRALDANSPARFQVLAYEKGGGAAERLVSTGQPEGISPQPGELFRIYGRDEGGTVAAGACFNAHRIFAPLDPFAVTLAGRRITPLPSTLAGDTAPTPAPRVRTRAAVVHLFSGRPLTYVRVMRRGQVIATATSGPDRVLWTIPVPRGNSRLVLDTGDRAYAGALSRLSHR